MRKETTGRRMRNAGFSLVEVSLAVLLVSIGLMVLFSLFPMGLREGEMAVLDTHEGMFADHVLSMVEGAASDIVNWNDWFEIARFRSSLKKSIPDGDQAAGIVFDLTAGGPHRIKYPKIEGANEDVLRDLRYRVVLSNKAGTSPPGVIKVVSLRVISGKYGSFDLAQTYATEVVFLGY